MSLNLDKSGWIRVRLGDVIRRSHTQVAPFDASVERYVAGGHIDGDSITIGRWGDPNDGQMGSTFRYTFAPGQVLFVSARPYLRKMGVASFSGVVADKTYVLDAIPERGLLQAFLPFLFSSEHFIDYATREATGSMNPRLLWGPLQRYEFRLPQPDDQVRLARLLWGVERHRLSVDKCVSALSATLRTRREAVVNDPTLRSVRGDEAFDILMGRQRSPQRAVGPNMTNYLRSANVGDGRIDLSDVLQMDFNPAEKARFGLAADDVLVSEGSASEHAVGMASVWRGDVPGVTCFQNTLLRYRAIEGVSLPGFAAHWCAWAYQSGAFREAASGTSIRHIGSTRASAMPVRLPGLDEQHRVVQELDLIQSILAAACSERKALGALRSSLLTDVFGGA